MLKSLKNFVKIMPVTSISGEQVCRNLKPIFLH